MTAKLLMRLIIIGVVVGTLAIISAGLLQPASSLGTNQADDERGNASQVGSKVGNMAPNFTLPLLNDRKVSLSDYRGNVVLLNFWRTDCASCLIEMPDLQKVYHAQQAARKDFVVLGIEQADDSSAGQLLQSKGITYPILVDGGLTVGDLYHVSGIPTSFVLDRQGLIRWTMAGPFAPDTLQEVLHQLS
jgi:cytochrome c biogenesis protein CcmG/thiol:disulfide interchange protein DsbE